jgi:hypothetical protein
MLNSLDRPEDPRWREDECRDLFLRRLLKACGWKASKEVVDAASEAFGVSRSTVFRWIHRFRATRQASRLLPSGRGTPNGAKRIDSKVERVIVQQIDQFWLKKEKTQYARPH